MHDAIVTAHVNLRRALGAPLSEQQRVVSTSSSVLSPVFLQGRRAGGGGGVHVAATAQGFHPGRMPVISQPMHPSCMRG